MKGHESGHTRADETGCRPREERYVENLSVAHLKGPNIIADGTQSRYQQTGDLPEGYEKRLSTEVMTSPPADQLVMSSHGASHLDALSHNFHDGKYFDRLHVQRHHTGGWCGQRRHRALLNGIVTRGVLILTIPRLKGVHYLEKGQRTDVDDLEAWDLQEGVKVTHRRCVAHSARPLGATAERRATRAVGMRGWIRRSFRGSRSWRGRDGG